MNIYEKLNAIQRKLNAPKNQRNSFGGYNYRSCEDVLEALKPLLAENNATLTITDRIVLIGDRFYVEASAILVDNEKLEDKIIVQAYAREAEEKKGMDSAQVTGATSSYARKYALNGLFAIDDNKDPDGLPPEEPKDKPKVKTPVAKTAKKELPDKDKISEAELATLKGMITPEREPKLLEYFKVSKLEELTKHDYIEALDILNKKK